MNNSIVITATKLAIQYSETSDIPTRLRERESEKEKSKINFNTQVEKRFQENVDSWKITINNILNKVETKQAWRFINQTPAQQSDLNSVVFHNDFIDFTKYFILRRDIENCDNNETGCLAFLHTAFQTEIEKTILVRI